MSELVRGQYGWPAGLRNKSGDDSYSCTVNLEVLADVHAAVHSAAARFVMILCLHWCFATDSDLPTAAAAAIAARFWDSGGRSVKDQGSGSLGPVAVCLIKF